MDSSDLYNVKQQFTLGAYKSLAGLTLPPPSSAEYPAFLLYKARAVLALGDAKEAQRLIPADTENLSLKAARSLARYVAAGPGNGEVALEELRDICVEVEGDDVTDNEKGKVKVLAATAFAREGEVEEALETLGVGGTSEDLEVSALVVQLYLSIDRPDLAKKEYERALKWADDDLLLESIEASIGLITGADRYANSHSYYSEQLGNPSLSSSHLLLARGITRLLRGDVAEARSDLEEVLKSGDDEETLSASVVAAGLAPAKKGEADELYHKLSTQYPNCLFVQDVQEKSSLFDACASKFQSPAPVVTSRA